MIEHIDNGEEGWSVRQKLNAVIDDTNASVTPTHEGLPDVTPDQHHNKEHAHDGTDGSGVVDHLDLTNVGENTHDEIDQHIDDADIHFTDVLVDGNPYVRQDQNWVPATSGGVTDHDDLTNVTADQHHAQAHAHDGADGSGTVAHSDTTGIGTDDHHNQVHSLYGSDHSDVLVSGLPELNDGLYWDGSSWSRGRRMNWRFDSWNELNTYQESDVVYGDGFTMIANKETIEYPFPRTVTDLDWAVFGTTIPAWEAQSTSTTRLLTGIKITPDASASVQGVRVWIPIIDPDVGYYIVSEVADQVPQYLQIFPFETGWWPVTFTAEFLGTGVPVQVYLVTQGQGTTSTSFTRNWTYRLSAANPNPNNPPVLGQLRHFSTNAPDIAYINKTDADGVSRKGDLDTLQAGDTIAWTDSGGFDVFFTLTADPVYYNSATTGDEDFYELNISPAVGQGTNGTAAMTFVHFLDRPTSYVRVLNQFALTPNVRGLLSLTGNMDDVVETTDAYGIDILYQEVAFPIDWDIVSAIGQGGGGGTDFTPTIFTGSGTTGYVPDPTTEVGNYLRDDGTWQPAAGGGGQVDSVVGGFSITVDATDPVNPIVNANTFIGAGSTGVVPNPVAVNGQWLDDAGEWSTPPISPIGGTALSYTFDTNTAATEPNSGDLRLNTADQTLATEMYVSATSRAGNDVGIFWENVNEGEYFGFWETVGNNESDYYLCTGPVVDHGTWFTVPVDFRAGTGGIENNRALAVYFLGNPAANMPAGGTTGQVLTKASDDSFDDYWATPEVYGQVDSVVGGFSIVVDDTDPANPEVRATSFTGAGSSGVVVNPVTEQGYFLSDDGTWQPAGGAGGTDWDGESGPTPILGGDLDAAQNSIHNIKYVDFDIGPQTLTEPQTADFININSQLTYDYANWSSAAGISFTGVNTYNQSSYIFGSGFLFWNNATWQNANGVTATFGSAYTVAAQPKMIADGAVVTSYAQFDFMSQPEFSTVNGGTFNVSSLAGFTCQGIALNAGCNFTTKTGFISNAATAGGGVLNNEIGFSVAPQTQATEVSVGMMLGGGVPISADRGGRKYGVYQIEGEGRNKWGGFHQNGVFFNGGLDFDCSDVNQYYIFTGGITRTGTLPQGADSRGREVSFRNQGTVAMTVNAFAGDTVDGVTQVDVPVRGGRTLFSDGSGWFTIGYVDTDV